MAIRRYRGYKRRTGFSAGNRMGRIAAAIKRVPPRALILICVAAAAVITFACVSAFVKGSGAAAPQAAAASETGGAAAPQTTAAPDAALASAQPPDEPASPQPSPEPSETDPLGGVVFKEGMTDPIVASIQQRLMDLSYMDGAEPTELYGPMTAQAVTGFQRQAGLTMDGLLESQTYTMLMSPDAPKFEVSLGAQGPDVEDMIYRLYELDYLNTVTDTFTETVKTAVEEFQETNDLDVDGIIGGQTRKMLYSDDAIEYGGGGGAVTLSLNVTQETNLSPNALEDVLSSSLSGLGRALYDGEQDYGINSLFILAIINYESGYGTSNLAQTQNNLGGLKGGGSYKSFSSKAECIDYMYDLLSSNYIGNGLVTIEAIGEVYCGGTWAEEIKGYMQELIAELS